MNILITGAKGFVGRNLVENLKTIQDGRNKTYPELTAPPSTSPIKENSKEINTVHQTKTSPQSTSSQNPQNTIEAIYEYDLDTPPEKLDDYCRDCDIVFNLAGVNRPKDNEEFMKGNFGFASTLLDTLKKHNNKCPVMGQNAVHPLSSILHIFSSSGIPEVLTANTNLSNDCSMTLGSLQARADCNISLNT